MKSSLSFDGFEELDSAFSELPKATKKAAIRRSLRKRLQPVAQAANDLWPGADDTAFAVSDKLKRSQSDEKISPSTVIMYVGSTKAAPEAHLREFGTEPRYHKSGKYVGAVSPMPSLGPAWEAHKADILSGLVEDIREEFEAALSRRRARGK